MKILSDSTAKKLENIVRSFKLLALLELKPAEATGNKSNIRRAKGGLKNKSQSTQIFLFPYL